MTVVEISDDLKTWAELEVATGRAQSVADVVEKALLSYRQLWTDFRQSLDDADAEAEGDGWLDTQEVFDRMEARLRAAIDAEEAQASTHAGGR